MRRTPSGISAFRFKLIAAAVSAGFASGSALANPTGGVVVNGAATMATPAPGQLHITNSPNAIIHWQGFSIGPGELTRFIQESASSAVLNRVVTSNPSDILGTLLSNGRVFLINPNGILFGSSAVVDVAGLVAASLNLSDADFLAGNYRFQAVPGAGGVENQGTLRTLVGGPIYLVGPAVTNGGLVDNPGGEVILAAGESVELMSPGTPGLSVAITASGNQALNLGHIAVDSGRLGIFAGLINQGGSVSATSAVLGADGSIQLVAKESTTFAAGSNTAGGPLDIDTGDLVVAGVVTSGAQNVRASGGVSVQNGSLNASNGQVIEAQYLEVEASAGGFALLSNFGGEQRITTTGTNVAGESLAVRNVDGSLASIQGIAGIQTIDAPGRLTVQAGLAGPAFVIGDGDQAISADSILLQGGSVGSGASAQIASGFGSQAIHAGAGGITLLGGDSPGANNFAMINQGSTDPATLQTVHSDGPVLLDAGDQGTLNFAMIRAFGSHQAFSAGDTTLLAGAGGVNNFSVIQARSQDVAVHGDLRITAGGSGGTPTVGGGARIGGLGGGAPSGTDLALHVDGSLFMTGGTVPGTGVLLGNSPTANQATNVTVAAGGDVVLNPGTAPNALAAIGQRTGSTGGGNISVSAGGEIALNSAAPDRFARILTADSVFLDAQRISEDADARIEAASLSIETAQGASLVGDNAVDGLSASNLFSGDVAFHNTSGLLTVTQALNIPGTLSLQQTGDLLVSGNVFSGPQDISVTGGLRVENLPFGFAQIGANAGQTIDAGYIEVIGNAGGSASIFNFGGEQRISTSGRNAAGEGLAVRAFDGGFAVIDAPTGAQTIEVRDAERMAVDAVSGFARVTSTGGRQSISLAGTGANALVLGSPGALFQSFIAGDDQAIVAGNPGEGGSITLHGTADGSFGTALMITWGGAGGNQSVSTSGALSIFGGTAPGNSATGIFANQAGGEQSIWADAIALQGGATGFGNSAMIGANAGSQTIHAGPGGIALRGGAGGGNNFAQINQASTDPAATQSIHSAGPVLLEGGSGNFNFAMIRSFGGHQEFEAGNTTLLAGAGGIDNFATIQGRSQDMTVHGDLAIVARGSAGNPNIGGGARIGGTGGGSPSSTDLRLNVDGNLTMTGGSVPGTGVLLGNTPMFTADTDIDVRVGGDVTLNGGSVPGTFAVIGSRAGNLAGGDISIEALNGTIALDSTSPDQASILRTTDAVLLTARQVTQGRDARIEAGSLHVSTQQGASLIGDNSVNLFNASNTFGDLALHNASSLLTVQNAINPAGGLSLVQSGHLWVTGTVASGLQTIDVSGGLVVQNDPFSFAQIGATGGQTINAGYVEVNSFEGGSASIFNFGGEQRINTSSANAAGEGLAVRAFSNGFALIDSPSGSQTIEVRDANRVVLDAAGGSARISASDGPQSLVLSGADANALHLRSAGFGQALISGNDQAVRAGAPSESGSITIEGGSGTFGAGIFSNPRPGGAQSIATTGALTVVGATSAQGFDSGIFANGPQLVSADSIVLSGGAQGAGNGAVIFSSALSQSVAAGAGGILVAGGTGVGNTDAGIYGNNGPQSIHSGGGITLLGGAFGTGNFAQINVNNGPQQVSASDILLVGGTEGFNNNALLRSSTGPQVVVADQVTLQAGTGGTANFAAIVAPLQDLTVHGDVSLTGGSSASSMTSGGGALIGGGANLSTSLVMDVGGSVTLNGGSFANAGAGIGSSSSTLPQRADVTMNVQGDVTLNPGLVAGTRIGTRPENVGGGEIVVNAGGTIALNSAAPGNAGAIRTTEGVRLTANRIEQGTDAEIQAGALSIETQQGASLVGHNRVSSFNATNQWFGDIALHNTSPLLTVTGVQNWNGGLALQQVGDMRVSGSVSSGPQNIEVTGGLVVQNEPSGFAQLSASGGQTIDAGYVEVNAVAGGSASIFNFGGEQAISATGANAAGETLVVRGTDGGFAGINGQNGPQTIALSGPGPNALVMGSPAGSGFSVLFGGDVQTIVAGTADEAGSITLYGPAAQLIGGTQTVSTSGALRLLGSATVTSPFQAGLWSIGVNGHQTVRADSILMQGGSAADGNGALIIVFEGSQSIEAGAGGIALLGGPTGNGNFATIEQMSANTAYTQTVTSSGPILLRGGEQGNANGAVIRGLGGPQTVVAGAGGLTLIGGESGSNNFAQINQVSTNPAATQTVVSAGPVHLQGGSGNLNFAMIRSFGGHQTLSLGPTSMLSGAAGIDNFTSIQGRVQDMVVHGDLTMTARGSAGSERIGGGSRIGGVGGNAPSPTELALTVEGNLTMTAGTLQGTGTLIGSFPHEATPNDIDLNVWGNVTLNGGTQPNTVSRIGAAQASNAGGTIAVTAGGTIALNSSAPGVGAVIRTADGVSLSAQQITQGPDARIEAGSLTTQTAQGVQLGGANSVSGLAMLNSASGDVAFNNTSALLTVTGIGQVPGGALSLHQSGNLLINGDVISGAQSIGATGDMSITPGTGPNVTVRAHGPQTFSVGGTFSLLGGAASNGFAQTLAQGPVTLSTGNDLLVRAGGGLLAYALLHGSGDVRLTVGDELRIDGGTWPGAFARIQAGFWDRIFLTFPNRDNGGYFVDGHEGATIHGLDGFFTGVRPAVADHGLIVSYGE